MSAPDNTAPAGGVATTDTPGRPARDAQRPECRHWIGAERRHCRKADGVRLYVPGLRCPAHTPRALQGLPEFPPGPGWPAHRT